MLTTIAIATITAAYAAFQFTAARHPQGFTGLAIDVLKATIK